MVVLKRHLPLVCDVALIICPNEIVEPIQVVFDQSELTIVLTIVRKPPTRRIGVAVQKPIVSGAQSLRPVLVQIEAKSGVAVLHVAMDRDHWLVVGGDVAIQIQMKFNTNQR